jgi:ATP-dependent Clp protease ATP-binding subunit ClpA
MFERFTDRARRVMALANQEAYRFGHPYVGTEHVLLGLLREGGMGSGVGGCSVMRSFHIDLRKVRVEVEKRIERGSVEEGGKLPYTPATERVVECAIAESLDLTHEHVGTEHILLGLLKEKESVAHAALSAEGLYYEQARERIIELASKDWVGTADERVDPRIAAIKELLPKHGRGIPSSEGGAFEVVAHGSSLRVVHWIVTNIDLTSDDLAKDASKQAAMAMRSAAERLEKAVAELRESARKLEAA